MMDGSGTDTSTRPAQGERALTLFLLLVTKWRRLIFWTMGISTILSLILALSVTPQFRSTASVLPATRSELLGALGSGGSLTQTVLSGGLASLGRNTEIDRYLAILYSDRVLFDVIERFDLTNVYEITSYPREKTRKALLENLEVIVEPVGNLSINVYDEDPQRAADMTNTFVELLNAVNTELLNREARETREFIERRYKNNVEDLRRAEDSLRAFQKRHGIVAMPEQATASVKVAAEFAAELAVKEIELEALRRIQPEDNALLEMRRVEVEAVRRKMAELNSGEDLRPGEVKTLVPFSQIPDLTVEFVRRYRDVQIQNRILEFLTPIYEQAKVEEQRQTPSVIVLDRGVPAERKARPKRLLIVLAGMLTGLMGMTLYIFLAEKLGSEREAGTSFYRSLQLLLASVRADAKALFRRRSTD